LHAPQIHPPTYRNSAYKPDDIQSILQKCPMIMMNWAVYARKTVTPAFPKKTKCITICMPGSSFMHIVTYKCIQKQYHTRKRKIIRDLRLILETKASNFTCSRLGVAYA
jgi:hypothetical protein